MKKRGQIGIEYLIVVGFVTFTVISIFAVAIYYSNSIKDKIVSDQIENFAYNLISSSESVYFSGEPSELTVTLYLPKGVTEIKIQEEYNLVITSETSSGINRRAFESRVPLYTLLGTLDSSPGTKILSLKATENNVDISISEGTTQQQSSSGLILYLPLNGDLNDDSGNGNDGSAIGTMSLTDAFSGSAFFSSNGAIKITNGAPFKFGTDTDFSVSMRVYQNQYGSIFKNRVSAGDNGIYCFSENVPWFRCTVKGSTGDVYVNTPNGGYALGSWNHLVVTASRTGLFKMYINGQHVSSGDISGIGNMDDTDNSLVIGSGSIWGTPYDYNGFIDEVGVWNRALSDTEVQSVYDNGVLSVPN